jgi:hypothetical protein
MEMGNIGFGALTVFFTLVIPVVLVVILLAIFVQIRNVSKRGVQRLEQIYRLLLEQGRDK